MIRDQFWFGAAGASLWLNKVAWRVYSFSERLRVACLNIWMHPRRDDPPGTWRDSDGKLRWPGDTMPNWPGE